jgi:tRNA G18 (ribose-2'-O)-methylase SpoU
VYADYNGIFEVLKKIELFFIIYHLTSILTPLSSAIPSTMSDTLSTTDAAIDIATTLGDVTITPVRNEHNVAEKYKYMLQEDITAAYRENSNEHCVAAINITGDLNIGTMMRTSCLFGMRHFYIVGRRAFDRRARVGSNNYIAHSTVDARSETEGVDASAIEEFVRDASLRYNIVYIEQKTASDECIDVDIVGFRNAITQTSDLPFMFIVGNEGIGIPSAVMKNVPGYRVEIPQRGVMRSHNVSIALSIVLWEFFRGEYTMSD